jgi:P-type Ca2+ transporter type 2C
VTAHRSASPHAVGAEDALRGLGTDPDAGLSDSEAELRLARSGPNRLAQAARPPYGRIAARQFADPLVALLVVAALVSIILGERIEAAAIAAIVLLNAMLGFTQEERAERAVLALRDVLERRARVIRSGSEQDVDVEHVVPGDLALLREGERVPADGRVLDASGLAVDESTLTGESIPIDKTADPVPDQTSLAERSSMVFAGTAVTRGRGRIVVIATGSTTELGRIAGLTAKAESPPTPLQRRVAGLTRVMVLVGGVVIVVLAGAMLARGSSAHEAFLVAVSVAVAAVPEGLAATVTIALALGAREMAARGAIVRRLNAVETLGSATVIASDKTGTLTENRLRLVKLWPVEGRDERDLLEAAALASTARLTREGVTVEATGDPVDTAVALAADDRGLSPGSLLAGRRLVRELPFDPHRKRMTLVYEEGGTRHAYVKGAPEAVLECSLVDGGARESAEGVATTWAAEGLKVLAVAERPTTSADESEDEIDRDFRLVGLVALHDPLRETAHDAVQQATGAGLRVQMLTGDHRLTATAIGRALGLPADAIHARVTPAEKLKLVEALQSDHEVVAVTGDGVNDAPALRQADVGVAMGRSGTEAAREAADLVLTDDDFATIVAAIRAGRTIADNIRKFVAFLLSANLGEVVVFTIAILAGFGAPMTVVQVLLVNILTDGLPAIALTRDQAAADTMRRGPERGDRLFPPAGWAALAAIGAAVGLAALGAFVLGGSDGAEAATMAFATIALSELALVFSLRSPTQQAWNGPRNRYLTASVVLSASIVLLVIYVPALQALTGTATLDTGDLGIVGLMALVPFVAVEACKPLARRLELPLAGTAR